MCVAKINNLVFFYFVDNVYFVGTLIDGFYDKYAVEV